MTTIPSTVSKDRFLEVEVTDDGTQARLGIRHNGELAAAIYVNKTDLCEALECWRTR